MKAYLNQQTILYHALPARKIALELGAPVSTNLAMIGFFAGFNPEPFTPDDFRETITSVSPDKFRDTNLRVFEEGLSAA